MSKQLLNNTVIDPNVTFIEKTFEKVARENNLGRPFGWSTIVKPFEKFTMYSDNTPTVTSSNTLIVK